MAMQRFKAKVLVVDDETHVRDLLVRAITSFGYQVVDACNVSMARLRLADSAPFDLVITDIRMPGESGLDLLAELASQAPQVAVIISTGVIDTQTAIESLREGAYDYITKPFDLSTLHRAISRTLEIRRLQLENLEYRRKLELQVEQKSDELDRRREDLAITRVALVRGLCRLTEFRDNATGSHLERIATYCAVLARELDNVPERGGQMGNNFLELIVEAAPLHDIGKVGIPDGILLKPGPLSAQEDAVMRRHTLIGREALISVLKYMGRMSDPMLDMAIDIASKHHEWWDGNGYPFGLTGDEIALSARIAAVADYFDACTSPRIYRPRPMDPLKTAKRIESLSGKQFDPVITAVFKKNLDEILAIRRKLAD